MTNIKYPQMPTQPVEFLKNRIRILDQSKLPLEERYVDLNDYHDVVQAIKQMKVRGAPAIGVVGAYGIALTAIRVQSLSRETRLLKLTLAMKSIAATRPTAVNLFRAIDRMKHVISLYGDSPDLHDKLSQEAILIHNEERESTEKLSLLGASLIDDGFTILTHCNAGPLATTGYGTALGIIIAARDQGKRVKVIATETRPLLQGARLTTWEMQRADIPVVLITDSMAGYFMYKRQIDCVIVGADRIALNGDVANKIGTYTLAVLAKENGISFYVAAPYSTIDLTASSGEKIPIEQRQTEEVTSFNKTMITSYGIKAENPAFDITPHSYVTGIITERGIITEPYCDNLMIS